MADRKSDADPKPDPAAQRSAGPPADETPGKLLEPAAPAGAESQIPAGLAPPGQGAQVVLTGDAQAAARGGVHDEIAANTAARDAAIAAGHVVAGTTAAAAADATVGTIPDEIDEAEAAAIAKARADAHAARVARAAKAKP